MRYITIEGKEAWVETGEKSTVHPPKPSILRRMWFWLKGERIMSVEWYTMRRACLIEEK